MKEDIVSEPHSHHPTTDGETLASGVQSQDSGMAPTETWLCLGTAGLGSASRCPFGFGEELASGLGRGWGEHGEV